MDHGNDISKPEKKSEHPGLLDPGVTGVDVLPTQQGIRSVQKKLYCVKQQQERRTGGGGSNNGTAHRRKTLTHVGASTGATHVEANGEHQWHPLCSTDRGKRTQRREHRNQAA